MIPASPYPTPLRIFFADSAHLVDDLAPALELPAGAHGVLLKGKLGQRSVIVKEPGPFQSPERALRELTFHCLLSQKGVPYIVPLLGYRGEVCPVIKKLPGPDLFTRYLSGSSPPPPFPKILQIVYEMLAGLAAMHQSKVFHHDIKWENLVLGKGGLFFIDWSLVSYVDDYPCWHLKGTRESASPELLLKTRVDSEAAPKIDIFSVGILLFEMLTGLGSFYDLKKSGEGPYSNSDYVHALIQRLGPPPQAVVEQSLRKEQFISLADGTQFYTAPKTEACQDLDPWEQELCESLFFKQIPARAREEFVTLLRSMLTWKSADRKGAAELLALPPLSSVISVHLRFKRNFEVFCRCSLEIRPVGAEFSLIKIPLGDLFSCEQPLTLPFGAGRYDIVLNSDRGTFSVPLSLSHGDTLLLVSPTQIDVVPPVASDDTGILNSTWPYPPPPVPAAAGAGSEGFI
jgi:serine/threonine protein kinase